jgi:hypothetical protein
MNLNLLLKNKKIKELTYDTVFTEVPMSNLVDFDYRKILNPPPENTSYTTQKELNLISYTTLNKTQDDYDLIFRMDEDTDSFYVRFLKSQGQNYEYPKRYIDLFYDIVEPVLMNTKSYWNRPRPAQLAKLYGIQIERIVTDTIHTASYPSGHTVYSKLVANILSDMYPQFADSFNNIAKTTGIARIKQGVHYPSDNKSSFTFSDYLYKMIHPKIQKYL